MVVKENLLSAIAISFSLGTALILFGLKEIGVPQLVAWLYLICGVVFVFLALYLTRKFNVSKLEKIQKTETKNKIKKEVEQKPYFLIVYLTIVTIVAVIGLLIIFSSHNILESLLGMIVFISGSTLFLISFSIDNQKFIIGTVLLGTFGMLLTNQIVQPLFTPRLTTFSVTPPLYVQSCCDDNPEQIEYYKVFKIQYTIEPALFAYVPQKLMIKLPQHPSSIFLEVKQILYQN